MPLEMALPSLQHTKALYAILHRAFPLPRALCFTSKSVHRIIADARHRDHLGAALLAATHGYMSRYPPATRAVVTTQFASNRGGDIPSADLSVGVVHTYLGAIADYCRDGAVTPQNQRAIARRFGHIVWLCSIHVIPSGPRLEVVLGDRLLGPSIWRRHR